MGEWVTPAVLARCFLCGLAGGVAALVGLALLGG